MKKGCTELVFILDRSGSMRGLELDTIGGFNSLIEKQKKQEGEVLVSVVLFDDRQEVLYDRLSLDKVEQMNENQYYVRGCTALLDTLGSSIRHIINVYRYIPREDIPEKTMFIVTTDGLENASHKYNYSEVKRMIEIQKEKGWEFLFLGANMDAVQVAESFGINRNRAVNYECDAQGTALNYEVLDEVISSVRSFHGSATKAMNKNEGWANKIKKDYQKRHK